MKEAAMPQPIASVTSSPESPTTADVVVIGGGIIGVTAALSLAERGLKVVLIEKGRVAAEQSSRNWGWVRQQGRDRRELPLIVAALAEWQRLHDAALATTGIDTGFRRKGLVSLTREEKDLARWGRWAVRGRAAGIAVDELSAAEAEAILPSTGAPWLGGLRTPTDGGAEPAVAVPAFAELAKAAGVIILQDTAARALSLDNGRVTGVITERGPIAAPNVLVAAGAWTSLFLRHHGVRLPQLGVRSTVLRTTPAADIYDGTLLATDFCLRRRPDTGYTVTLRSGEIFDLVPDGFRFLRDFFPLILKNFSDFKLRFGAPFFQALGQQKRRPADARSVYEEVRTLDPEPDRAAVHEAFEGFRRGRPEIADLAVADAWAGMIDVTPDIVPVIATVPERPGLTVATGFSGHGFGIGPGAGRLAADLVAGDAPLVDPTPFRLTRFNDGTPIFIDPDVI
jgi:glycine/D-amino acid oxidase-like deaminating enzyme